MIKILKDNLINKIAAGEVVERPASVVKELMENAIDAKSTKITVKIKDGGLNEIIVEDNGKGISKSDLDKLFVKHATSKINDITDLQNISTFGFRGEALASIASVSDITIITKTENSSSAYSVNLKDGIRSVASNNGTRVLVENLFKNIPARRKFMKSEKTENAYIIKIFREISLINSNISFVLYINDKEYLNYPSTDINTRIKQIIKVNLLPYSVFYDSSNLKINAAVLPIGSIEKRYEQYIYVNKRPIESSVIQKSIKDAYKSYLRSDIRPSFFLDILIDPTEVDVNVHPRKIEVRFLNQFLIFNTINKSINKYFEKLNDVKVLNTESLDRNSFEYEIKTSNRKNVFDKGESIYKVNSGERKLKPTSLNFEKSFIESNEEENQLNNLNIIQIDNKFLVFGQDNNIVVIDQHAASERINYEKYLSIYKSNNYDYIIPLIPINIELDQIRYSLAIEEITIFESFGIIIEDMGNCIISVTKFSNLIPISKIEDIIFDILNNLNSGGIKNTNSYEDKVIASIACRSAIMFGQKLEDIEMKNIINELYKCKVPFTCAHGRPIKLDISYADVLKKLARC